MAVVLAISLNASTAAFLTAAAETRRAVSYELSPTELALDCKKLTGRMRLRILQLRTSADRHPTSEVSRTAQSMVTPFLGGSQYGADPAADQARDRAILEAYNRQLAAKSCRTIDLEAELRPQAATPPLRAAKP
jgi:hypothetical protein